MSEQLQIIPEIKDITQLMVGLVPTLEKVRDGALAWMSEIETIETEDQREDAAEVAALVRDGYNKMVPMRKDITGILDEMKNKLMEYERPLEDKKDSPYGQLRAKIAAYDQKKIDEKKKVEEAAAKKKLRENLLVDIGTAVLQNLNNLILKKTKEAESKSKAFFDSLKLDKFDDGAETYRKMKPNLRGPDYSVCFLIDYDVKIFSPDEFSDIIATIKEAEPFEKWNEEVVKACGPIINEWRAKIPQLKENLIKLKNASDESERSRLKAEQDRQAQAEADRRARELEQLSVAQSGNIAANADLKKLENDFVEQATTQVAGDTGPVKLVLQFTDAKKTLKALSTIIYHCMASPAFPGIYKKDKNNMAVLDAKGRPEHIQAVQFWVDFFMKNCDAAIDGTIVLEDAKTIIRK
jgi:hypothetical protein